MFNIQIKKVIDGIRLVLLGVGCLLVLSSTAFGHTVSTVSDRSPKMITSVIKVYVKEQASTPEGRRQLAYSPDAGVRSKSEVVEQVKNQYDAQVLKIKLNSSKTKYQVRILLPDGKVRNITVSAKK